MDLHPAPHYPAPPASERDQAALLAPLLEHDAGLSARERRHLLTSVMAAGRSLPEPAPAVPRSLGAVLLRPGMVQAQALALNYALVLGLDLSGSLDYTSAATPDALLALNYVVLSGLMMGLSFLCIAHAFMRADLRRPYRAMLVAMATTGIFGLIECMAFTLPDPLGAAMRLLLLFTIPMLSVMVALYSLVRAMMQPPAEQHTMAVEPLSVNGES